jgi:Cu2+-containing amine oxidase
MEFLDFAKRGRAIALVCFLCCALSIPAAAQKVEHPLDPLTFQEYWTVLEVLRNAGHLNDETRFSIVNLHEPPKDLVWSWVQGQDFPRDAFAVVRQGADAYEALVDLKQRRVVSGRNWTTYNPIGCAKSSGRWKRKSRKTPILSLR